METHQQVTILIEKLNRDWDRAISGKRVSRIDKDILIEDIRQIYDLVYELETGKPNEVQPGENTGRKPEKAEAYEDYGKDEEPAKKEELSSEPRSQVLPSDEKEDEDMPSEKQKQDPGEIAFEISGPDETKEPDSTEKPDNGRDDKPVEGRVGDDQKVEKPNQGTPQFTSDKFSPSTTLADVYQKNGDNSLAARMQKNRITDLKSAIGINDKFLFINEIFKGHTAEYNKAIEIMNRMDNYHEAIEHLDKIKEENDVQNQEACGKLLEILKRRFQ